MAFDDMEERTGDLSPNLDARTAAMKMIFKTDFKKNIISLIVLISPSWWLDFEDYFFLGHHFRVDTIKC